MKSNLYMVSHDFTTLDVAMCLLCRAPSVPPRPRFPCVDFTPSTKAKAPIHDQIPFKKKYIKKIGQ